MIKLIEIVKDSGGYSLREVFINPKHVAYLREDSLIKRHLVEGKLPEGLDTRQAFTKLIVDNGSNGMEFIVVGEPSHIESKLKTGGGKKVLNG